nr:MAG TPA: hypothetical protein [Caudoviricetes sp.]
MHSIRKLLHEVQIKKCAMLAHFYELLSHFLVIIMLIIYLCHEQRIVYIWKRILLLFQMKA